MSENHGRGSKILVLSEDEAFGSDIVSAVEETDAWVRAEYIDTPTRVSTEDKNDDISGVIIDCKFSETTTVVSRLTSELGLPVIGLADSSGNGESIAGLLEAGVTDIFPRTTEATLYELVVEKITTEASDRPIKSKVEVEGYPYQVTERRRMEPRLREILDRIDEAIYFLRAEELTNPSLHPDDFHSGYEDIWGQPLEEIFNRYENGFFGTLHPEDRSAFREFVTEIGRDIESGTISNSYLREYRIERSNGEHRWIRSDFYPTEWGPGPLRMLIVSRDITERKRREREYEQIFNMAGDGIVIHDPESGEIVDANEQVADLLGYERDAFFDQPLSEFQATDEGVSGPQAKNKILQSAQIDGQEFEWPLETSAGETVWVRARHETGYIDGDRRIVALLHDITERRRREQEYEQIFNGVQDAIVVHDPESDEIVDVNEAFCELVGYDRDQILKLGTAGVSVEEEGYTQDRAEEIIAEVIETGEVGPFEWKVETKAGEHRLMEVVATTAQIGSEVRHLSIQRDITERKRREQRLDVFNRILRHNLRNQLDVIRSHAEVLADQTGSSHAERIIAAVDKLAGIGARARKIDRAMSMDETPLEINLSEELRETVEEVQSKPSAVTVTTKLPEKALLQTNKEVLRLAVESAIENAVDYR